MGFSLDWNRPGVWITKDSWIELAERTMRVVFRKTTVRMSRRWPCHTQPCWHAFGAALSCGLRECLECCIYLLCNLCNFLDERNLLGKFDAVSGRWHIVVHHSISKCLWKQLECICCLHCRCQPLKFFPRNAKWWGNKKIDQAVQRVLKVWRSMSAVEQNWLQNCYLKSYLILLSER